MEPCTRYDLHGTIRQGANFLCNHGFFPRVFHDRWPLGRSNGARVARSGGVQMSGLPADFDPLSPSMDHLSMIDEASKGRSHPQVTYPTSIYCASACGLPMSLLLVMPQLSCRSSLGRNCLCHSSCLVPLSCHAAALLVYRLLSRRPLHLTAEVCFITTSKAMVDT